MSEAPGSSCPRCGVIIAPSLLSCPSCHALVHGEQLTALARQAEQAESAGQPHRALSLWRDALSLLPSQIRQHQQVLAKVERLSREAEQLGPVPEPAPPAGEQMQSQTERRSGWLKAGAGVSTAGLLLWKLKTVLALVLTKGKLLLLGLGKSSTLLTMVLSFGLYWTAFGMVFALGLVLSIYVHEMGHVAALQRFGIRATAPMFIPGFGAVVRLKQHPATPREDATVGLAGPLWGLGASLCCLLAYVLHGAPAWAAIAQVGAWINLFNLLPVWQLDGARAFAALSRGQRWFITACLAATFAVTREGLLVLILLVAGWRSFATPAPDTPDWWTTIKLVVLIVALSALCLIPVDVAV